MRVLPPADLNGDGHPDLVWHNRKADAIRAALPFDPGTGWLASSSSTIRVRGTDGKRQSSARTFGCAPRSPRQHYS
ncbi:MAG: hypothetical protein F4059_01065 [Gemmatimonadetes bacterium]|nr:hypothetical protein [Gemmatimonadota bacterium]